MIAAYGRQKVNKMNGKGISIKSILSAIDARGWKVCCHEDLTGGLHLAIWRGKGKKPGKTWFCHYSYEYNKGQLVDDLIALAKGYDPKQWEHMNDMTREEFWEMVNEKYSGQVVLYMDGVRALWRSKPYRARNFNRLTNVEMDDYDLVRS